MTMNQEAYIALQNNENTLKKVKTSRFLPYIICTLAAMFYLYEFVLQVSPAVMTNELMHDFKLNAAGLGAMAAFYYYAYTPMQIPAGLLYDRYGPRLLITIALLICAMGAFFFGLTNNVAWASAGRFFMGIGSAFSFIGSLVLVARWFPAKHFALLAGLVQMMSSIGAILGEAPLAKVVHLFGWRQTITWVSLIGVGLALLVWLVIRDRPAGQTDTETVNAADKQELQRLKQVCKKSQTWWIALYSFTCWAPITAFAALWGIPCLVALYGISTTVASTACSMIWVGIGLGSPFIGWCSDRIGRRCLPLTVASIIGAISLVIALYVPHVPLILMYILLFFFGTAASGQSLAFGLVKDQSRPHVVGTAIGFNNMAVVAGGALFQPLVGLFLDWNWTGEVAGGIPAYSATNYRWALLILPTCYVVGAVVSAWRLKETHCLSEYFER
jgi:MFS family permease